MGKEIWKDIQGYEGLYQVSNLGNVKSLSRKRIDRNQILPERLLTKVIKSNGYQNVTLSINSREKKIYVHRLVAEAFINKQTFKSLPNENRELINLEELEINHKDENKTNNCVKNLEWCTAKYNMTYNDLHLKHARKILQYDLQGNFIKEWESISKALRHLHKPDNRGDISDCLRGKQKTAFGYIWKTAVFKGE